MLRKIIKSITPPICISLYKYCRNLNRKDVLFDGDDDLFKRILLKTKVYGEYGCGASTKWVLNNTDAKILAVDTSSIWINKVLNDNLAKSDRLSIEHADLGKLGNWGRPIDYSHSENFSKYTDWIWLQEIKPDTVLIDGRFRICCFLTTLKYAKEGTRILFDDYVNRPHYHFVEKYLERTQTCGRQCLFIIPSDKKN